jgi:hypothetical protein
VNSVEETVISAIKEKKILPHDPLCEYLVDTDGVLYGWNRCDCDLISKVREDTITASVKRLEALTLYDSSGTAWIADPMNKVIAVIQASEELP